ncbi:filamentous haemagglutinin family protein [uncultured Desulfobacter sp.]|uniref:filamentous haemagglutinin family protein n=1 Tax=uncultured Desulfobacter sp. TaxID=240139 RepID=UPI002AA91F26|nr:filamentous haemagglutinin family protein [uncultured Desulfobacter sp.]
MKNLPAQITKNVIVFFLGTYFTFFPAWLSAKPLHQSVSAPASDALPVLVSGQTQSGWSASSDSENHYLQVDQTDEKVVIKWESFDIGSDSHTHFEQVEGGVALNRIYDNSPSQIYGKLTATGSIYLVNQNGILFGEGSRTNVGSIVASSLNIAEDDFQDGIWKYQAEDYDAGDVENRGTIASSTGGNIFLLGGNVENSGTISSEGGRIFLAGASEFEWTTTVSSTGENTSETVDTDYSGNAVNSETGEILADVGKVGLYGDIVQHDGLIRSLSTVVTGSSIQLVASKKVITGENSTINSSLKELENPTVAEVFAGGREINISINDEVESDGSWSGVALYGDIIFPSGEMTIDAGDGGRIYLAPGSSIDLSGSWVEKSASDAVLSAQLNSLELRDEFLQKNSILSGETIYFLLHEGVSIGNISDHLDSRTLSVWEQSMEGGTLTLEAGQGDIIVDSNATIDISGGGIHYAGGYVQTTKLVSDGVVYDISDAPETLVYDSLINYGENFSETYTDYISEHTEGYDAGTLSMSAKQIFYEGNLDASVVQGYYQVNLTDPVDSLGYQTSIGTKIPSGGTLIIGDETTSLEFYEDEDPVVDAIVIKNTTSGLEADFNPETSLLPEERNGETWLSDDLLNNSGLSVLQLNATRSVVTESDTTITLAAGGRLTMTARRILHQGIIEVPSGTVDLSIMSNKSSLAGPDYVSIEELGQQRIELAAGSIISTAGEIIDNYTGAFTGTSEYDSFGLMDGGSIILRDQTVESQGVVLREGATLDVSGGYIIGDDRDILDSGDAGSIEILGGAIILDGTVTGTALYGNDGGSITLHAGEVRVVADMDDLPEIADEYSSEDPLPEEYEELLIIDDNRFDDTGFTQITLKAVTDITLEENVSLSPSLVKLSLTSPGRFSTGLLKQVTVPLEYAGSSAISLTAGTTGSTTDGFSPYTTVGSGTSASSYVTVKDNASLQVAPEGEINIKGPGVDISGSFSAPAGTISVNSKSTLDQFSLCIRKGTVFDAGGFNYQSGYLDSGEIIWAPADGGEVSLSSNSALIIEDGVTIDVSGAEPVTMYRRDEQGRLYSYTSASEPGSISLSFSSFGDQSGELNTDTVFLAEKYLDTLRGGSFYITALNDEDLDIPVEQLNAIAAGGFDYLELASGSTVSFMGSGEVSMTRGILIDTPVITGTEGDSVTLNTYWMQLLNSYQVLDGDSSEDVASLVVNSGFIDITGDVKASGFDQVELNALYDIRLEDYDYLEGEITGAQGAFAVDNDLTLTASRIYPTSGSSFNINAGGNITTLGSGITNTSPIYSALGSLVLNAHNIYHWGVLAAPGGSIWLNADETTGRIYLGDDSVLSVALEVDVNYGDVDEGTGALEDYDNDASYLTSEELPEKQISLRAHEVIGRENAVINLAGGESVYGYTFIAGTSGSLDPLTVSGRFVVLPAENVMGYLPGQAIYLEENSLLDEGVYVVLPEAYAFLEGAVVLELQGSLDSDSGVKSSAEGYVLAVGYDADSLTGYHSSDANLYTVRLASDVLSEGEYEYVSLSTGNGGSLEITANTTILNNAITAAAKNSNYQSGVVTLSGENVIFSSTKADLGSSFNFDTSLEEDENLSALVGTLYLDAEQLSQAGLWELNIGSSNLTETITFEENSVLTGSNINLTAINDIIFNENSGIEVTGENSAISLLSVEGSLIMAQDSFLRSSDSISIDAASLAREGDIEAQKQISLSSENLYIVDQAHAQSFSDGFVVDQELWESFSNLEQVTLTGREKTGFAGVVNLEAQNGEIFIDTPLVEDVSEEDTTGAFKISAAEISLYNTGTDKTASGTYTRGDSTFSLDADRIYIGQGDIQFSNFGTVSLTSQNNLTFVGEGSVDTGNADLVAQAAMTTGAYRLYLEEDGETIAYEALDFDVDSGAGKIKILQGEGDAEANGNIGGSLSFTGNSVSNQGTVFVSSGFIGFTGTGTGDAVTMGDTAKVSVSGSAEDDLYYDAGVVKYEAENGNIVLSEGSVTDVSAGSEYGNSGTIWVESTSGNVDISGTLLGSAVSGEGGSFIMNTQTYGDLSLLVEKLSENGFSTAIDLTIQQGDVSLAADVTTSNFRLSAYTGDVDIDSVIDASGITGGLVEIYSGKTLTLSSSTRIYAGSTGSGEDGGSIILGSGLGDDGYMHLNKSVLDVSAHDGTGGSVYLRVARTADNTGISFDMDADAKIIGASSSIIEAVKTYQDSQITASDLTAWKQDASSFLSSAGSSVNGVSLIAGIEVQTSGDMKINTDIDLTGWRFGSQDAPIALSFTAGGNLTVDGDILDYETVAAELQKSTAQLTSFLNFKAGAVLTQSGDLIQTSDSFAVQRGTGNLAFADKVMVYTEGGNINFASGGSTTIGKIQGSALQDDYMSYNHLNYNLASYSGTIRGKTGADLNIKGGVIQTATGDISLDVGGDLNLLRTTINGEYYLGTIRTTGQSPVVDVDALADSYGDLWDFLKDIILPIEAEVAQETYSQWNSGGSISIQTGGDVNTMYVSSNTGTETFCLNPDAWDGLDVWTDSDGVWSANYDGLSATQGIATMGGGDVSVNTLGSFYGQAGTFGEGDLNISAMGDINGRFLNKEGGMQIAGMGSIGSMSDDQVIELFDSQAVLSAQGNITLASVLNPGIAADGLSGNYQWNLQYTQETSVAMTARTGDITLTGRPDTSFGLDGDRAKLLPPDLYMKAGRDVVIKNQFYMPPSASGNIEIYAGRDITGDSGSDTMVDFGIYMSDLDPDDVYGDHAVGKKESVSQMSDLKTYELHAGTLVREDDYTPAVFEAGNDIRDIQLAVPKAAVLTAGRDIANIKYVGQNIHETDSTVFYAGRDIYFSNTNVSKGNEPGILVGGPGLILVQAGNNIDLGASDGIQATGSVTNSALTSGSNDLMVIAGYAKKFIKDEMDEFFDDLRQAGIDFIAARSDGDETLAEQIVADTRENVIALFFDGSSSGEGNISLVNSKIYTSGGSGNIYTLAGGTIDVGLSSIASPPILGEANADEESSGIYTTAGGAIKIYARDDINVNESRVMTFAGGDIDILSDYGDINAGRGSKAAVASSTTYYVKQSDGTYKVVYEPPAVGSGVRATAPDYNDAGDIYATAWEGDIDAGEAGIAGNNVTLAAQQVLNAQNIQTTGLAIGFTKPSDSSGSIGGLTGSGGVSDTSLAGQENTQLASAQKRFSEASQDGYTFEPKWVDVEVVGFGKVDDDEDDDEDEDKQS